MTYLGGGPKPPQELLRRVYEKFGGAFFSLTTALVDPDGQLEVVCHMLAAAVAGHLVRALPHHPTTRVEDLIASSVASAVDVAYGVPGSRVEIKIILPVARPS